MLASSADRKRQSIVPFLAILDLSIACTVTIMIPFANDDQKVYAFLGLLVFFGLFTVIAFIGIRSAASRRASITGSSPPMTGQKQGRATTGRISQARFNRLVEEAVRSLPESFYEQTENVVLLIEHEPSKETSQRVGVKEGAILLGLYQGVPRTAQGYQQALLPERITLYQKNIEISCRGDPERIREQIRTTLLHEVAHHFGMDHEAMPLWLR